jgi:regulatory protein
VRITAIKAQVRNSVRVSVYVDEKYAFSLNHAQLLEQKLHIGLEVDSARLSELKKASDFGKLHDRILNYITIRARSRREVVDYCRRKKYDPVDCKAIIEKMAARGYINDEAFAKAWIESRRLTKTPSARKLKLELKQKGITDDIINQTMQASGYDERAALAALIAKKRCLFRFKDDDQKLMQYLARQGFGFDDIRQALEKV